MTGLPSSGLTGRSPNALTGTLDVSVNGHHTQTIDVNGIPRLYTLYQAGSATSGRLLLHASPGVQAYDFTFG